MSSTIPDMDETIAKAMQDIGWPGADQVQDYVEDDPNHEKEEHVQEPETDSPEGQSDDTEQSDAEPSDGGDAEPDGESENEGKQPAAEQPYQPKWKKAALKVLDGLPSEKAELLRQEDKRREEAFHKGIEQYREGNNRAREYDEAIKPYLATINSLGAQPVQAVQHLLAADHNLRYSPPHQKVGFMLKIMQDYGINPSDVVTAVSAVQEHRPQIDPVVQQLQNEVSQMKNAQYSAVQRAQSEQQAKIDSEIAAFSADPDNEHFEGLKNEMAALLTAGVATNLKDAYDQAMRVNPKTSALWLAQQQQKWSDQRKAKVESVKKPTNVRSNGRATASTPTTPATMEETIRAQAQKLGLI